MGAPTENDLDQFQQFLDDIRTSKENLERIAKEFNVDISDELQQIDNAVEDLEDIMEDEMMDKVESGDDTDDD